jgi:MFS family permease
VAAIALALWATRVPPTPVAGQGVAALFRVRRGALWAAVWLVTLPALFAGAIEVLLPLQLDALGAAALSIGAIFLVGAVVEATISPIVGRLSDRRGRLAPIKLGLAAAVAIGSLLPLIGELALMVAGSLAIIAALAMFWAPAMALLSDVSEAAGLDLGLAAALMNLAWAGGHVGGGALGGPLADAGGDELAYGVLVAACLITLLAIGARRPIAGAAIVEARD